MYKKFEWVLQTNLIDQKDVEDIKAVLNYLNIKTYLCNVIPFEQEQYAVDFLHEIPNHDYLIPYGSTSLIKHAKKRNWLGVYFDKDEFTIEKALKNRNDCLNQDAEILRVNQLEETYKDYDPEELFFIRPNDDLKTFSGQVVNARELCRWSKSIESGSFDFPDDTLVIVAPPQNILAEWRYFVCDHKIISGSTYRWRGKVNRKRELDEKVLLEAQKMAEKWLPSEICTMDLALTDKGLKFIESNNFNSAGWYNCDLLEIVKTITEYNNDKSNI